MASAVGVRTSKKDAWRVKSLRSTFGPQCLATASTAPASSFGSALRDSATKTFVSIAVDRARAKSSGGNNSPGPIYSQPILSKFQTAPVAGFPGAKRAELAGGKGSPGPGAYNVKPVVGAAASQQPDSTKANMPSVRFGHALREAEQRRFISREHDKTSGGRDSPGPSAYNSGSLIGTPAKLSTQVNRPAAKIGTNIRFKATGGSHWCALPGPGQYSCPDPRVESHFTSLPRVGFAKAQRDANKKIFISLEHEKAAYGESSPGPGTAVRIHAVGKQLNSKAKSAPIFSFGTGRRLALSTSSGPGPGEYYA